MTNLKFGPNCRQNELGQRSCHWEEEIEEALVDQPQEWAKLHQNELPCYTSDFVTSFTECHNFLQSPTFLKYPGNLALQPQTFEFTNTRRKKFCCKDSLKHLKVYGSNCTSIKTILGENDFCNGSETFSLLPCSPLNLQENSKFCKFPGFDCILEKSFVTVCSDVEPKSVCDIKNLPCNCSVIIVNI